MTWVFILIALTSHGATVERVLLDSPQQCMAYASGYMSRPELRTARVQVSQCIGLRSGAVIEMQPAHQEQHTS